MLIKDPLLRITPEEALVHPYFIRNGFLAEKKTTKRSQNLSVIDEEVGKDLKPSRINDKFQDVKFNQITPLCGVSISVNDINDNDVNLDDSRSVSDEKKKKP
jgi:hypothetical protein